MFQLLREVGYTVMVKQYARCVVIRSTYIAGDSACKKIGGKNPVTPISWELQLIGLK